MFSEISAGNDSDSSPVLASAGPGSRGTYIGPGAVVGGGKTGPGAVVGGGETGPGGCSARVGPGWLGRVPESPARPLAPPSRAERQGRSKPDKPVSSHPTLRDEAALTAKEDRQARGAHRCASCAATSSYIGRSLSN